MIAAFDAHYDEDRAMGTAAAVIFTRWEDSYPVCEVTEILRNVQPYVPGEFYRRELPGLLAVLEKIREAVDVIVLDGYVSLNEKPALGRYLFQRLGGKIPVIGVAKSSFHGATAHEVFRGKSKSPLYVTAAGVDPGEAAKCIRKMHGPNRLPTLLKRVDQLARGIM